MRRDRHRVAELRLARPGATVDTATVDTPAADRPVPEAARG
jgi:hypothetical protein